MLGAAAWNRFFYDAVDGGGTGLNPVILIAVSMVVMLVMVAASLIPVRRALRIDPLVALRHE